MNANAELVGAARNGDLDGVKRAVNEGADVNYHSQSVWAPIIHAARNGHLEIVKFLIEHGADMNIENPYKETALCLARNREVVEYLTKLGAKP